jgi:hypothetical protein
MAVPALRVLEDKESGKKSRRMLREVLLLKVLGLVLSTVKMEVL